MKSLVPELFPVACHTDRVMPGGTFVAIKGTKQDGTEYIPLALAKGAKTIVVQREQLLSVEHQNLIKQSCAQLIFVENIRKALAELSAQVWQYPSKKLKCIGVTGTKGKTTSCFLIEHMLRTAGYNTALISSIHTMINGKHETSELTTPHPDYLQAFLASCVQQNIDYVIIEAAAQAFSLYRLNGIEFDAVLFTNFAQAHGEFYTNIDEYFAAKCMIIKQTKYDAPIVVNGDDELCLKISENQHIKYFSCLNRQAQFYASNIETSFPLHFVLHEKTFICEALSGEFNIYNIVGALALVRLLGISSDNCAQALQTFTCVPGRMEKHCLANGTYCFIDKAHNISSFHAVLPVLRQQTKHLIVVFGAGGERDRSMRPHMGQLAAKIADIVILTTDNPRSEDPVIIIQDIYAGITEDITCRVIIEPNRYQAILMAYQLSTKNSLIALLGKGSEEYQLINGVKHYFSERKILKSLPNHTR